MSQAVAWHGNGRISRLASCSSGKLCHWRQSDGPGTRRCDRRNGHFGDHRAWSRIRRSGAPRDSPGIRRPTGCCRVHRETRRCSGGDSMIIVTGATGFIGSNLVADLNAAGRSDIILVDDLGTEAKWKNIAKRRFEDIVLPAELNALLGKLTGADAVYHMGANSSTTETNGDALLVSNWRTSKSIWEWCAATRTPLLYASSAATY